MDDCKFQLGQTLYSAHTWMVNRYVFIETVTYESVDGTVRREYTLEDSGSRKVLFKEKDFNEMLFATIDEARVLCKQNWEVEVKKIGNQIDTIDDSVFDEIQAELKAKKAQQGK